MDVSIKPDSKADFVSGLRAGLPVIIAILPFGLLFGALAVDNGLTAGEAVLMSALVYGGASQMVGIELFGQRLAPWVIVLSIFAVNFRHVLYSAALGRRIAAWPVVQQAVTFFFLSDPQFAETERHIGEGLPLRFAWYAGLGVGIWICWIVQTAIGAYFGGLVADPHRLGLDFLLPIYFLGLVMSFRKRPRWLPVVAASAVVSVLAERLVGSPWHISIGALAGIALAAALPATDGGGKEQA